MENEITFGILHNRKTAGTLLKTIIDLQKQVKPLNHITYFEHSMSFPRFVKEFPNARAIFFIREPISRFVSGFYSRMRQGLPRYHYPWSKQEAKAFALFKTPNELAEQLSSFNLWKRYQAFHAMQSIGHIRHTYQQFLGSKTFLQKNISRIAFIGHQVEFDDDIKKLYSLLNLDSSITIPNDHISTHRNPDDINKSLSLKAENNLKKWYQVDFEIYNWCLDVRKASS